MPAFVNRGLRLHYTERGAPDGQPIVLLHGLLWSSRMFQRLAGLLPEHRLLLLDLRGHGQSSRPADSRRYTWPRLASDVTALLDHLELDRAVVGGLSLGANVSLAVGLHHPDRVEALVLEMPVLSRGHPIGKRVFSALAGVYGVGTPVIAPLAAAIRRVPVPSLTPDLAAVRDVLGAEPRAAHALLRGLLDEEPLPEDETTLATVTAPALVVGHKGDLLHVLDDARDLAARLPNARLVETSSILELRLHPDRLAAEIRSFLADVRLRASVSANGVGHGT